MQLSRRKLATVIALLTAISITSYTLLNALLLVPPFDTSTPTTTAYTDHVGGDDHVPVRILLVSALFPLANSKHSEAEYAAWVSYLLGPITTDIYFYAPPVLESHIRTLRGSLPITLNTSFLSPFDVPPLQGRQDAYTSMHASDREKHRHSPELYAVWNAKPYLVDAAVRMSGREWDYVFWVDAGSFRTMHEYTEWPDPVRVATMWHEAAELTSVPQADLIFFPFSGLPSYWLRNWQPRVGPVDAEISEGSFYGGTPRAAAWWARTFYMHHDAWLKAGRFVGKDQTVINALLLMYPGRIFGVIPHPWWYNTCGGSWWHFQFVLASSHAQSAMRELWELAYGRRPWYQLRECWPAKVVAMREMLQKYFGVRWRPPPSNMNLSG